MRLRRLDLTRYGRFTDHSIDFGEAPAAGTPDLHLIYGPNEAGKSTTQSAWLDLLFGIPTQSRYGFRHPYDTMRIAALIETPAGLRHVTRIKRNQRSLLDGEDRPLPDSFLQPDLTGLDRAAYQAMFCLDDDTLEAGGKSILESRGELGQLLFAASAGLADLSRTLSSLREEADRFYKPNTRRGTLAELKSQAIDLKSQLAALDTTAAQHNRLAADAAQTKSAHADARTSLAAMRARFAAIDRQLAALPHLAALQRLRADLAPLATLPTPPVGWAEAVTILRADETRIAAAAVGQDAELAACAARLAALVLDPAAAGLAPRRDALAELRARYVTAELDLADRIQEQTEARAGIAARLARLAAPPDADPATLLIPTPGTALLEALLRDRSGIARDLANARTEHAAALQAKQDAAMSLPPGAAAPDSVRHRLVAAIAALRNSDHEQRRRAALRAAEAATRALAAGLTVLRPWTGTAEDLAAQTPPDAPTIAGWITSQNEAVRKQQAHAAERTRLTIELARLTAARAADAGILGLVTDAEAATLRTTRDTAWAAHRRVLDAETADAFEAALRQEDLATETRLRRQIEVVRAQEIVRQHAIALAEYQHLEALAAETRGQHAVLAGEIAAALAAGLPGLPGDTAPDALPAWLTRRSAALAEHSALSQAESDRRHAEADAALLVCNLAGALAAAGEPVPVESSPEVLLAAADAVLDRDVALAAARTRLAAAESALTDRKLKLEVAYAAEQEWNTAWVGATGPCWFAGAPPAAVAGILAELPGLATLLAREADLARRIADMQDDQSLFAAGLAPLAAALGLDPTAASAGLAINVDSRIDAALATARRYAETAAELARRQEDRAVLAAEQARHAEQAQAMCLFFATTSLDDVADRLATIETRTGLLSSLADHEAALRETLGTPTAAEAETALAGTDRDSLAAEREALATEIEAQAGRTETLLAANLRAADALAAIGGDDAVARVVAARRIIELAIETDAARHIRLRVGILAADMALRAYRDRHRSAMMARASDAFRTISRGAYISLSTTPDKDSETLIAISADGTSKRADDLSKGTRFQLYLALRAAGHAEFATAHRPVPFIADDIMETFDDLRAEETFRVLGDMAHTGQVIYLTHHSHLCPIAARVVPEARVHRL